MMTNTPESSERDPGRAAELYALAQEQEARREYDGALKSYAASLRLCDDEKVRAAYFRLMAIVGPE